MRFATILVLLSACDSHSSHPDAAASIDASGHDAARSLDAPSLIDAAAATPPMLQCEPANASETDLCTCMANLVCDEIYYCLSAAEIATKPAWWSPRAACVEALDSDCQEDLGSGPSYFPADFRKCVADLATRSCAEYGQFTSVSASFPPTCANLRSLDTGLSIPQ